MKVTRTFALLMAFSPLAMTGGFCGDSLQARSVLQITLDVRDASVTLDGELKLHFTIKNLGPGAAYIYGDLSYGVVPIAYHRDGAEVPRREHFHELCPPPPPEDSDFVRLKPGHARSYDVERTPRDLGIDVAGDYLLEVDNFYVTVRDREGFHISLVDRPLVSNRVEIVVRAESER